jgi:intraflagellar transport protein 74
LAQSTSEAEKAQTHLASVNTKIAAAKKTLKGPQFVTHTRGVELMAKKRALQEKKMELDRDVNSSMTPEEMKNALLEKVKTGTEGNKELESRVKQMERDIERMQDEAKELEQTLAEARKHALKSKKYEAVYERDRKMQHFLDQFSATQRAEVQNKRTLQDTIVSLMQHISKNIDRSENLPSAERMSDLQNELSFKGSQKANSEATLQRMKSELGERRTELDKILALDKKLPGEIREIEESIRKMKQEMVSFKDIDGHKVRHQVRLATIRLVRLFIHAQY